MTAIEAQDILQPQKCYGLLQLNELIGIPPTDIIEAVEAGHIARSLGEGIAMHVLGIDIIHFLEDGERLIDVPAD